LHEKKDGKKITGEKKRNSDHSGSTLHLTIEKRKEKRGKEEREDA